MFTQYRPGVQLVRDVVVRKTARQWSIAGSGVRVCAARVLNLPSNGRRGPIGLDRVRAQLKRACDELDHACWPDDRSLRDGTRFNFNRLHSHNQITDAYLLALAVTNRGSLLTFDRAVALEAVIGATVQHLTVL